MNLTTVTRVFVCHYPHFQKLRIWSISCLTWGYCECGYVVVARTHLRSISYSSCWQYGIFCFLMLSYMLCSFDHLSELFSDIVFISSQDKLYTNWTINIIQLPKTGILLGFHNFNLPNTWSVVRADRLRSGGVVQNFSHSLLKKCFKCCLWYQKGPLIYQKRTQKGLKCLKLQVTDFWRLWNTMELLILAETYPVTHYGFLKSCVS